MLALEWNTLFREIILIALRTQRGSTHQWHATRNVSPLIDGTTATVERRRNPSNSFISARPRKRPSGEMSSARFERDAIDYAPCRRIGVSSFRMTSCVVLSCSCRKVFYLGTWRGVISPVSLYLRRDYGADRSPAFGGRQFVPLLSSYAELGPLAFNMKMYTETLQLISEDYSYQKYPALSLPRYSFIHVSDMEQFIQVSDMEQCRKNDNANEV